MILDIQSRTKKPVQLQGILRISIYPTTAGKTEPEIVVYFEGYERKHIPLKDIISASIYND